MDPVFVTHVLSFVHKRAVPKDSVMGKSAIFMMDLMDRF
jgi:hypothetical protein